MSPAPDSPDVIQRMRAAHARARAALHALPAPDVHDAWGWQGRTLGQPVTTPEGPAWLRVASAPTDQIIDTFWNGAIDATRSVPGSIPRARLLGWHDWTDRPWSYRAELYERVTTRPVATSAILTIMPVLPTTWWAALRAALDDLAAIPTNRVTIHQGFLAWAMPRYLGSPINTNAPTPWTTAHGDFHYANICGPDLRILDWEGWGTAPAGYDAAMLHSYSLLVPAAAARVHDELAYLLDTRAGRFAELAVISELLHTTTHGDNLALVEPLRRRATLLLGRENS
jgi:Phosphotransferase enzyme family